MKFLYAIEKFVSYLLYFSGVYWIARRRLETKGAAVALVYHRVMAGRSGAGEMVGEEAFAWQMRYLRERCRPVGWPEIRQRDTGVGIRVLVTFDDGYRDNFTRAMPVMERNEIPGIFFVVTDFVFDGQVPGPEEKDDDAVPSRSEIEAANRSRWITIGNHTASHSIASRAGDGEFDAEIERSQARLREVLGNAPRVFAWPRGRTEDVTQRAAEILENHDIEAAFTMAPGRITGAESPYFIPRVGMSHVNDSIVFKVKLLGLLGPLVKIKNALGA